jgi:hypothetical protein
VGSIALSVKMNIMLFFPAFGLVLYQSVGALDTALYLCWVAAIQVGGSALLVAFGRHASTGLSRAPVPGRELAVLRVEGV